MRNVKLLGVFEIRKKKIIIVKVLEKKQFNSIVRTGKIKNDRKKERRGEKKNDELCVCIVNKTSV